MRLIRQGFAVAAVLALAGLAWRALPPAELEARFGPQDCRVLAIADRDTGAPLAGIEDIAAYRSDLFLSVQDRLAAEAAAVAGEVPPEGGLYRIGLSGLAADGPVALAQYADDGFFGPLHPHGIDARLAKLVAVNRRYGPEGAIGRELRVYAIRPDRLEPLRRVPNAGLCAANDVMLDGVVVRVSLDRSHCPGISLREAAFGGPTGRLGEVEVTDSAAGRIRPLADGLAFANGVTTLGGGAEAVIAVAETRASRVALLAPGGQGARRIASLEVPGGPDNLTVAPEGQIVAALHPDLLRLALYRHGYTAGAPSRIVAIDPDTGSVEVLFDDPGGTLFSGASVGVLTGDGRLVAGSVRAPGLLVCGGAR